MNHSRSRGKPRRPAEHALGIAPRLRPRQGEDQRGAARPQMRARDPGLDDVEPRRVGERGSATRRSARLSATAQPSRSAMRSVTNAHTRASGATDCRARIRAATIFKSQTGSRHRRSASASEVAAVELGDRVADRGVHLRQRDAPVLPARLLVALFLLGPLAVGEGAQCGDQPFVGFGVGAASPSSPLARRALPQHDAKRATRSRAAREILAKRTRVRRQLRPPPSPASARNPCPWPRRRGRRTRSPPSRRCRPGGSPPS